MCPESILTCASWDSERFVCTAWPQAFVPGDWSPDAPEQGPRRHGLGRTSGGSDAPDLPEPWQRRLRRRAFRERTKAHEVRTTDTKSVQVIRNDFMQFVCDCVSSSESRISTAHNILSMFRPRSTSEQDKLQLLSNLCRIYSKEPKEVKRAVLELTDMQAKNVRHVTASTQSRI